MKGKRGRSRKNVSSGIINEEEIEMRDKKIERLESKIERLRQAFQKHLVGTRIVWFSIPMLALILYDIYAWLSQVKVIVTGQWYNEYFKQMMNKVEYQTPMDAWFFWGGMISTVLVLCIALAAGCWYIKEVSTVNLEDYEP